MEPVQAYWGHFIEDSEKFSRYQSINYSVDVFPQQETLNQPSLSTSCLTFLVPRYSYNMGFICGNPKNLLKMAWIDISRLYRMWLRTQRWMACSFESLEKALVYTTNKFDVIFNSRYWNIQPPLEDTVISLGKLEEDVTSRSTANRIFI